MAGASVLLAAACQWPWWRARLPNPQNWSAPRPSESVSGLVASATGGVGSGFGIRRVGLSAENSVWICYL